MLPHNFNPLGTGGVELAESPSYYDATYYASLGPSSYESSKLYTYTDFIGDATLQELCIEWIYIGHPAALSVIAALGEFVVFSVGMSSYVVGVFNESNNNLSALSESGGFTDVSASSYDELQLSWSSSNNELKVLNTNTSSEQVKTLDASAVAWGNLCLWTIASGGHAASLDLIKRIYIKTSAGEVELRPSINESGSYGFRNTTTGDFYQMSSQSVTVGSTLVL